MINIQTEIAHPRAVLVLGMHRSGTSVLARALASLGVYLGSRLLSGHSDNPKGHFEDKEVLALNEELLHALNSCWDSLLINSMFSEHLQLFLPRAVNIIQEQFSDFQLWGLKDPRITRLLSFWEKVFHEIGVHPVYVLSNRHPLSVAASVLERNAMPKAQALALWLAHQTEGLKAVLNKGGIVVDYDNLLANTSNELSRLCAFLDLPVSDRKIEIEKFANEFLDQNLCHTRYEIEGDESNGGELEEICKGMYLLLRKWSAIRSCPEKFLLYESHTLIDSVEKYLSTHIEWLMAIDALNLRYGETIKAEKQRCKCLITEKEKEIAQLKSKLDWVTDSSAYKVASSAKNVIKNFLPNHSKK